MNYFLPSNSTTYQHHHHQSIKKQKQQKRLTSEYQESFESDLDHEESNVEDWTKIEINPTTCTSNQESILSNLETNQEETQLNLTSTIKLDSPITNLDQSQLISKLLPNDTYDENQLDSSTHFDPQAWKRGDEVKRSRDPSSDQQAQSEKLTKNLIPISNKLIRSNRVISNELRSKPILHRIPSSSSIIPSSSPSNPTMITDHIPHSSSNPPPNPNLPRWRPYLSLSRMKSKNPSIDSIKKINEIPIEEAEGDRTQLSSTPSNKSNSKKDIQAEEDADDDVNPYQTPKDWWSKIYHNTWKLIGISSLVIALGIGIGTRKRVSLNRLKSTILTSFKPFSILYHL